MVIHVKISLENIFSTDFSLDKYQGLIQMKDAMTAQTAKMVKKSYFC